MVLNKSKARDSVRFRKTRSAHQTELAEDYVETILDIIQSGYVARLTDVAQYMGVAHPTASKTLKKLARDGLVKILPYKGIILTSDGLKLAKSCQNRHKIVLNFLLNLGLDLQTAQTDAEGIEHHVSPKTLKAMSKFKG
jgi:DtxR family manganese transport transcriptional regulator